MILGLCYLQITEKEDPLKLLANGLRTKHGIEWRSAILQDQRVELFRGKDFAAYFRKHEDKMALFVNRGTRTACLAERRFWAMCVSQRYHCPCLQLLWLLWFPCIETRSRHIRYPILLLG